MSDTNKQLEGWIVDGQTPVIADKAVVSSSGDLVFLADDGSISLALAKGYWRNVKAQSFDIADGVPADEPVVDDGVDEEKSVH